MFFNLLIKSSWANIILPADKTKSNVANLAFFITITIKRLFVLIVVNSRDLLHEEKLNLK